MTAPGSVLPVASSSPGGSGEATVATKRSLIALSFAIERVAYDAGDDAIVIALFQRGAHFAPMASTYAALASRGLTVVVGFADDARAEISGVTRVFLADGEPLGDEWSVVVLAPTVAAYLVGKDLDELADEGRTLENRRRFRATWGFDRAGAAAHAKRILAELETRIPADIRDRVEAAIVGSLDVPTTVAEAALGRAALCLTASLDDTNVRLDDAKARLDRETTHATRDPLTGLTNREGLQRWLGGSALNGVDMPLVGVVLIDLDGFKLVNDTFGHDVGDQVLQAVARVLTGCIRPGDIVSRWGGDEFVVLCPGAEGDELTQVARRMVEAVGALSVGAAKVGASAGTKSCRHRPIPMGAADAAMYAAKRAGGNSVVAIGSTVTSPSVN